MYLKNRVTGKVVRGRNETGDWKEYKLPILSRILKSAFIRDRTITLEEQLAKPKSPEFKMGRRDDRIPKKEWRKLRSLFGEIGVSREDTEALRGAGVGWDRYVRLRDHNSHEEIMREC